MPATTQTILQHASSFHRDRALFYQKTRESTEQERVRMFLDYLIRHEERLVECLERYEKGAEKKLLNSTFQVAPTPRVSNSALPADPSIDEIVRSALDADDSLISMYRETVDHSPSTDVRNLFNELLKLVERDEHQLARDAAELEDL